MTLEQLQHKIDSICNQCEDPSKVKVKLAMQPQYPMKGSILNICTEHNDDGPETIWLACSDNEAYGCPHDAWDESDIYDED